MRHMPSTNAIMVANDVKEAIRKHEKVHLGNILRNRGYSESVSLQPTLVTRTKSYRSVMQPYITRLTAERNRLLRELESRDLSTEDYRIVSEAFDRLNKNLLLAEGKATENIATTIEVVDYSRTTVLPVTPDDTTAVKTEGIDAQSDTEDIDSIAD